MYAFNALAIIVVVYLIWVSDEWYWRTALGVCLFAWILGFALETISFISDLPQRRTPGG
jgi:hypothetical protein